MKRVIQHKPKEYGQSMVELALTITILMVLLAGTMDLGRVFFVWLAMRDAAQEGASFASIEPLKKTEVEQRISDNLDKVIKPPEVFTINYPIPSPPCLPTQLTVTITYDFPITTPLLGSIVGDSITLHATAKDNVLAMCRN